jgi:hypothetical protein
MYVLPPPPPLEEETLPASVLLFFSTGLGFEAAILAAVDSDERTTDVLLERSNEPFGRDEERELHLFEDSPPQHSF